MEIYPAIDLIGGRCVRLSEGNFNARTDYAAAPLDVAKAYAAAGAKWFHVVDLDGAKDPAKRQKETIAALAQQSGLKMQTGGGVRSAADVDALLELGAARVIIGSLCVKEPATVMKILGKHGPDKIVLALDVRGDFSGGFFIATAGWQETSGVRVEELLRLYSGKAQHILCTDISKDGKMKGPNVELYRFLCQEAPGMEFQASGGVSTLNDLTQLKGTGAAGAIIGKALYEKVFTLEDALRQVA